MNFHRTLSAYFYALTLSLWSVVMPVATSPLPLSHAQELPAEKVRAFDQANSVFLVNQNGSYQAPSFRTDGDSNHIHFFNEGNFQFVFLKNFFAAAFAVVRARDINFEFIDLIYPFHYFW